MSLLLFGCVVFVCLLLAGCWRCYCCLLLLVVVIVLVVVVVVVGVVICCLLVVGCCSLLLIVVDCLRVRALQFCVLF